MRSLRLLRLRGRVHVNLVDGRHLHGQVQRHSQGHRGTADDVQAGSGVHPVRRPVLDPLVRVPLHGLEQVRARGQHDRLRYGLDERGLVEQELRHRLRRLVLLPAVPRHHLLLLLHRQSQNINKSTPAF